MAKTVGDFLIQRLKAWGVERIFGYPGDGINGIMGAMNRAKNDPEFILARHEEMAAFMATAQAKFSGELGVCLATSGPGAIHLLNGLYDAKLDHQPVLAIVGQQARASLGGSYQQEVDLQVLFKDVSQFVQTAMVPEQMPILIDRAIRIALSERTVSTIIIPADVQDLPAVEVKDIPHEHKYIRSQVGLLRSFPSPRQEDLQKAAEVINFGKKLAILVGQGARAAKEEVKELAEKRGAGIAKALLGKDVLPDDLPYVTGSIGLLGTKPSWDLMMNCDTLLIVGSSLPYSEFLPETGQARGVQIDIDGKMIGLRFPTEVNLVADAKAALRGLLPMIERLEDRKWEEKIKEGVKRWWNIVGDRAHQKADPINPQAVFWELSSRLPDDVIVTCDSGSSANWYARDLRFKEGMRGSLSGTLATMGCGVPYAIGAKFAQPHRPAIACVGDGAMQMNGLLELITIQQYWKRWKDPRLIVSVLQNNDLNQVTWEMRVMEGDPKFEESQHIQDFDYAAYAKMLGLEGIEVKRQEDVPAAWDKALACEKPCVIAFHTDPNVPPLPPHVKWDQAKMLMKALLHRDPDAAAVIKRSFAGKWAEYTA